MWIYIVVLHDTKVDRLIPYVDEWILCDVYNHELSLETIKNYLSAGNTVDGVMTFREESVLLTAKITDMLGMIWIPYQITSLL